MFLQTLKNALSPYKLGGAAGGSDFDPRGKSDNEVMLQSLPSMFIRILKICSIFLGSCCSSVDSFDHPLVPDHAILPKFHE